MHTGRSPAFATTVRVIDRIHNHTADGWPNSAPAIRPGFSDGPKTVLFVTDLTDRRPAFNVNTANFPGTQAHLSIDTLASKQLRRRSGGTGKLRTFTPNQFRCNE